MGFINVFFFQILSLRFGKDLRVEEIKRILQSSKPLTVSVVQKPEVRYVFRYSFDPVSYTHLTLPTSDLV